MNAVFVQDAFYHLPLISFSEELCRQVVLNHFSSQVWMFLKQRLGSEQDADGEGVCRGKGCWWNWVGPGQTWLLSQGWSYIYLVPRDWCHKISTYHFPVKVRNSKGITHVPLSTHVLLLVHPLFTWRPVIIRKWPPKQGIPTNYSFNRPLLNSCLCVRYYEWWIDHTSFLPSCNPQSIKGYKQVPEQLWNDVVLVECGVAGVQCYGGPGQRHPFQNEGLDWGTVGKSLAAVILELTSKERLQGSRSGEGW